MRPARPILLGLVVAIALPACTEGRSDGPVVTAPGTDGAASKSVAQWPYRPDSMTVHPLSRFARDPDNGEAIYECRIEFLDVDAHSARAFGALALVIRLTGGDSEEIASWHGLDLTDLEFNREHYDPITRTYLFRLRLEPFVERIAGRRLVLIASYRGADGRVLEADLRLEP